MNIKEKYHHLSFVDILYKEWKINTIEKAIIKSVVKS